MAQSYTNYGIFVPNRKRPVFWMVGRRIRKTATFSLYRERRGPLYLCAHPREDDNLKKLRIIFVHCHHCQKSKGLLQRLKWAALEELPVLEVETMHELTGYDS